MELFCECNSEWIVCDDKNRDIVDRIVMTEQNIQCYSCRLYKWHDADHENMMHDLKEMNDQ